MIAFEEATGVISKESKKDVTGNWRTENPCYVVAESLAELDPRQGGKQNS